MKKPGTWKTYKEDHRPHNINIFMLTYKRTPVGSTFKNFFLIPSLLRGGSSVPQINYSLPLFSLILSHFFGPSKQWYLLTWPFYLSAVLYIVGWHPAVLQALKLSRHRWKKEPGDSNRDRLQWFNGQGIVEVWSKALEQHATMYGRQWARLSSHLRYSGERRLPLIGGIDVQLAHQLPGKPEAGEEASLQVVID